MGTVLERKSKTQMLTGLQVTMPSTCDPLDVIAGS